MSVHDRPEKIPYKIGVLMDMIAFPGATDMFGEAVRYGLEDSAHLLDRPVEVVERHYPGVPWGHGSHGVEAFLDLVDNEKVLGIAGPLTTDNGLPLMEIMELRKVPVMTINGSTKYAATYAFNVSNGSISDEPAFMAAFLASRGIKTVACVRDYPSAIGMEYTKYFEYACQVYGLEIVCMANHAVAPTIEESAAALNRCRDSKPDCIAALTYGEAVRTYNEALDKIGWNNPYPFRMLSSALTQARYSSVWASVCEGWYGVDQFDERNKRFSAMLDRYENKKGKKMPGNPVVSTGYDIGRCYGIALSRMQLPTSKSLVEALETIRMLPSVTGGPSTYISFGPYDRRGMKGAEYLNIRHVENDISRYVPFSISDAPYR